MSVARSGCGAESIQRALGDKTTYMNQLKGGDHEPNPKALHTHLRVFALPDLWRYIRGADIDDLVLLWGVFVTSFVGIFLFREKLLP